MRRSIKRHYLDALRDRKLPHIRQAFDQARLFAWQIDGHHCVFTPDKAVRCMRELLAALVDDEVILGWKLKVNQDGMRFWIKVDYVYKIVSNCSELPKCFTCEFDL